MSFESATRQKWINLGLFAGVSGGTTIIPLPQTGIVARLWCHIYGVVSGTVTTANPLGMASIVNRIRVASQSSANLFDVSGAGYHYMYRDPAIDSGYVNPFVQSNARSAVTAIAYNVDMIIPLALNRRDQFGLVMLQNRGTLLQLSLDWAADGAVVLTGGGTLTRLAQVWAEVFEVPANKADLPDLATLHIVQEDSITVAGAGDVNYSVPVGGKLIRLTHGMGMPAADSWNAWRLNLAQSQTIIPTVPPAFMDMIWNSLYGRARIPGVMTYDMIGGSGLGNFGGWRDDIDMDAITEVNSIVTATAAGTLYTIRDLLVPLK